MNGSSPRVRGKRQHPKNRARSSGLIPARAGKTGWAHHPHTPPPAHPRACGENLVRVCKKQLAAGSSPRVRGKRGRRSRPRRRARLIPACAGKTTDPRPRTARCSAHPRVCGENTVSTKGTARSEGSSPRVRGKHAPERPSERRPGLIPACAGKTLRVAAAISLRAAHPRACGENGQRQTATL